MTRDQEIHRFLIDSDNVRDVLLCIGVPTDGVSRTTQSTNFANPIELAQVLQVLHEQKMLPSFLSQMVRIGTYPENEGEFNNHLEPLGLAYDRMQTRYFKWVPQSQAEPELQNELKQLLAKIDKTFPDMLDGAWEAFYSESKDKYRQALVSCRELLDDVLERLGNGKTIEQDKIKTQKQGKRKIWVRQIIGFGRESEIVTASANLISSLHGIESSLHAKPDRSTALFALAETQHILYFLLTHRSDKQKRVKQT